MLPGRRRRVGVDLGRESVSERRMCVAAARVGDGVFWASTGAGLYRAFMEFRSARRGSFELIVDDSEETVFCS